MNRAACRLSAALALASALACSSRGGTAEVAYRFVRLAQSTSEDVSLGFPVIDNAGRTAFFRETPAGTEVFRLDGRRRVLIWKTSKPVVMGSLAIGDRGDVAFPVSPRAGREMILRGRGGPVTTIATTADGLFDSFTFAVGVNQRGAVAFGPDLKDGDEGVFVGRGGSPKALYLDSTSFLADNPKPSINDRGWVAFTAFSDSDQGVFLWNGTEFVTIVDTTSPEVFQVFSDAALNDRGDVTFTATVDDPEDPNQPGPMALFIGRVGSLHRLATATGELVAFTGNPSINDRGEVAVVAELSATGEDLASALLVFSGEQQHRVIGTGDPLDGSRVASVRLADDRALNRRGQLVFGAHLEDGRFAIYRADPG
jgi:hypothetical protein